MKHIFLLLTLFLNIVQAQANFDSTFRNNLLINPDTNQPYTGNIEVLNNDWGKDAVEFSKDYVDGHLHGNEKVFYQSGKLKSLGHFNKGVLTGTVEFYYEDGSIQARVNFNNGNKQGRAISYNPSAGPAPVISMYESS
jgi:antitoxin component YwqK of YwqJK toxin-antitoxin module